MPTKVTDTILPTTMIGSYPKPRWFEDYNVEGADLLEWWKIEKHFQAFRDATAACIKDQERAGLDIVTDGQMHFDEYGGGIGSFVWYWYERSAASARAKLPNPIARGIEKSGRTSARPPGCTTGAAPRSPRRSARGHPRQARRDVRDRPRADRQAAEGTRRRRPGQPHIPRRLQVPGLALRPSSAARRGPRADLQSGPEGPGGARRGVHPDRGPVGGLAARVGPDRSGSSTSSTRGSRASTRRSPGTRASARATATRSARSRTRCRGCSSAGRRSRSSSSRSTSRCATWSTCTR